MQTVVEYSDWLASKLHDLINKEALLGDKEAIVKSIRILSSKRNAPCHNDTDYDLSYLICQPVLCY